MKFITRKCVECGEGEVGEAIEVLARRYASYKGDPVDDYREYVNELGNKCVIIMTPVGEYLVFEVKRTGDGTYFVELLASSWGEL